MVTITVTVQDSSGMANGAIDYVIQTFTVTVQPVNDAPTLTSISDVTMAQDSGVKAVPLTGISPGPSNEAAQALTITAVASDPELLTNVSVVHDAGAVTGTLSFQPASGKYGITTITVTVTDDGSAGGGGS